MENLLRAGVIGFVILVAAETLSSADDYPAGRDVEVRANITQILSREGYMARFQHGQDVKRGVSAYLWDNRKMLKHVDFHNARQTDVLVCVMIRKGYGNFPGYEDDGTFMRWCDQMLK